MTTSMIDATNAIPIPDQDAMLSGTSEKLMMPSNAYFSSFQKSGTPYSLMYVLFAFRNNSPNPFCTLFFPGLGPSSPRGVGVFTASPGIGKAYGIRCFQKELNENLYKGVYLCLTTISVAEFYRQICDSLVLVIRGERKTVMFKVIHRSIYTTSIKRNISRSY